MSPIRVLLVDDSSLFVDAMRIALEEDEQLVVCGSAPDALAVTDLVERLKPDVITMDLHMPGIDGLTAIERVLAVRPTPILVMTGDPRGKNGSLCLQALARGAVDVIEKASLTDRGRRLALCERIKVAARSRPAAAFASTRARPSAAPAAAVSVHETAIVAIAASTGGPAALATLLSKLPPDLPAAVLVVQHLSDGFVEHLARWLSELSRLEVRVARNGERLRPGTVLIAPDDAHMRLGADRRIALDRTAPLDGHRPSASMLFSSIAAAHGPHSIGIVLSGMGRDGADGLRALRDAGALTLVQTPETCVVDGMPRAAQAMRAVNEALPLVAMAHRIEVEAKRRSKR